MTIHSDQENYPQGIASCNTKTHLMAFKVTSVPPKANGWFNRAKVGVEIECYPFIDKAYWATRSLFYWSGNCELLRSGEVLARVGDFVKLWQGGIGVNGNPLPTCYQDTLFEGSFSIVFGGGTIEVTDLVQRVSPATR